MPGDPHSGSKVRKAPNREIGKSGENRRKVVAHWDFQPAAAFYYRENRRNGLNPLYQRQPALDPTSAQAAVLVSSGFLECVLGGFRTDPQHHASVDLSSLEPLENIVNRFERLRLDDRLHLAFGGKAQRLFQI